MAIRPSLIQCSRLLDNPTEPIRTSAVASKRARYCCSSGEFAMTSAAIVAAQSAKPPNRSASFAAGDGDVDARPSVLVITVSLFFTVPVLAVVSFDNLFLRLALASQSALRMALERRDAKSRIEHLPTADIAAAIAMPEADVPGYPGGRPFAIGIHLESIWMPLKEIVHVY